MNIKQMMSVILLWAMASVAAAESASPAGANAYIVSPANGEQVLKTFTVRFGFQGMGVAPAGVEKAKTGHFHLIIDGDLPDMSKPMDKQIKHFGGGQIETTLTLPKGEHTLQLIMGDYNHVPNFPPVVSKKITVFLK